MRRYVPAFLCVALGAAADPDKPRLEILPRAILLRGPAAEHGLLVDRVADGARVNVTRAATLASSRPDVVRVEGGRLRAVADGEAEIRVSHDGLAATRYSVAERRSAVSSRSPP